MTTSKAPSKVSTTAPTKAAAKKVPVKKPSAASAKPAQVAETRSLRFYLSDDLHGRLVMTLTTLESAKDASGHHLQLSETIVEVLDEGLDYYFIQPVKVAKAGFIVEQSANLGLVGVRRLMAPVIKSVLSRMDHKQLNSIASSIRELMK
jgi:hypothetical protein